MKRFFGKRKPEPVLVEVGAFLYGHKHKRYLGWGHRHAMCDPSAVQEKTDELLTQVEDAAYQAFGRAVTITRVPQSGPCMARVDIKGRLVDENPQRACEQLDEALNNPN